jgi:hypothetical protein
VLLIAFTISMFVSATLLFLVEPMIAKMALPLLGGSPAVWNTCIVLFPLAGIPCVADPHPGEVGTTGTEQSGPLDFGNAVCNSGVAIHSTFSIYTGNAAVVCSIREPFRN